MLFEEWLEWNFGVFTLELSLDIPSFIEKSLTEPPADPVPALNNI